MNNPKPEYMIRVKLPSSSAYHCSPSGDTEYEIAYDNDIMAAMPSGFEITKLKPNEKYAIDSEGRSIILIHPNPAGGMTDALAWYIEENKRLEEKINKIKNIVK